VAGGPGHGNNEAIPQPVINLPAADERRARVIWKCLRLKQEFPISYAEAQNRLTRILRHYRTGS